MAIFWRNNRGESRKCELINFCARLNQLTQAFRRSYVIILLLFIQSKRNKLESIRIEQIYLNKRFCESRIQSQQMADPGGANQAAYSGDLSTAYTTGCEAPPKLRFSKFDDYYWK